MLKLCLNIPKEGTCDDGDACTSEGLCNEGVCGAGQPLDCSDGNSCTIDSCHPIDGCSHLEVFSPCCTRTTSSSSNSGSWTIVAMCTSFFSLVLRLRPPSIIINLLFFSSKKVFWLIDRPTTQTVLPHSLPSNKNQKRAL